MSDHIIYPTYITATGEIRPDHECRFADCPGGACCPDNAPNSVIPCRTIGCEEMSLLGALYCDKCAGELAAEPITVAAASGLAPLWNWLRDHFSPMPQSGDLFAQYLSISHYGMTTRQFNLLPHEAKREIIGAFRERLTLTQGEPGHLFEEEDEQEEGCATGIACMILMAAALILILSYMAKN